MEIQMLVIFTIEVGVLQNYSIRFTLAIKSGEIKLTASTMIKKFPFII